eukprot:CAMPEP_0185769612 /NCGR_PEP_ID=MMETSP1174-20130828/55004_1 /TAXON_ID=35687 /ORGANISM="Dictyocha speculum, Strain CCMP1381" /LENGTH=372 /DNA_ID=CAMNT_0028454745 /DNA_START=76 /DNA_END=1194 /DNA_ORIENTATION=+
MELEPRSSWSSSSSFSMSVASTAHEQFGDEEIDVLTAKLDEVNRNIDTTELENEIFSGWIAQNNTNSVQTVDARTNRGNRRKHGGTKGPTTLTVDQKYQISLNQLDEGQKAFQLKKKEDEKVMDSLKAVLQETEMRTEELKKDAYEFKRDIVVGAENMHTGKIMAEKVEKYMEEKLNSRDGLIEKLRLKNQSIRAQIQSIESQLKRKEEMGDMLHYIDFHQLQIENKQHATKLEERNEELFKLKQTTSATLTNLNNQKDNLNALMTQHEWLKAEIQSRTQLKKNAVKDIAGLTNQIDAGRRRKKQLVQQQAETNGMPQVDDYVSLKAELYELKDALRNWERKVEIVGMEAKRSRTLRRKANNSIKSSTTSKR